MLDIQIVHTSSSEGAAFELCARLERGAECRARLQDCEPHALIDCWDDGLDTQALIFLLTPDLVPAAGTREAWLPLLEHVEARRRPEVAFVPLAPGPYPKLLERLRYLPWDGASFDTPRALQRWLLSLHETPTRGLDAAPQPYFEGRLSELALLEAALADGAGAYALAGPALSGKSALAQEFVRRSGSLFREVLWLECGARPLAALAGELGAHWGLALEGGLDEVFRRLAAFLEEYRLLLVLDNWTQPDLPFAVSRHGRGALLVTSRLELPGLRTLSLEPGPWPPAEPNDGFSRLLASCARDGFPLELAARLAGITEKDARARLDLLAQSGLVAPLDAPRTRYRAALLQAPQDPEWRIVAGILEAVLLDWKDDDSARYLSQIDSVLTPAFDERYVLAKSITRRACLFFKERGRRLEAALYYERLRQEALRHGDDAEATQCAHELSWLTDSAGAVRQPFEASDQLSLF